MSYSTLTCYIRLLHNLLLGVVASESGGLNLFHSTNHWMERECLIPFNAVAVTPCSPYQPRPIFSSFLFHLRCGERQVVEGDDQVSRRVGEMIEMVDRNLQDRSRSGIDQKAENSQNGWVRNEGEVWGN
jgi:hypothetical protein